MRNFYSPLKAAEPVLRFVFMKGITKFSQLSIFSELNNITNISMDEEYAGICGITKEELLTQMSDDIDTLAAKLTALYDGYHFTWPSPDVFNPFSLLNCLSKQKLGAYWFGSGTPTYLINMMRKFRVQPDALAQIESKHYTDAFKMQPKPVVKVGMPFMMKDGVHTLEWKVVE